MTNGRTGSVGGTTSPPFMLALHTCLCVASRRAGHQVPARLDGADHVEERLADGGSDGGSDPRCPRSACCTRPDWDRGWGVRVVYVQFVCETFGDADGIGVVDESGFIRRAPQSVGVKRQYSGTAGKVENCQIGTFLSYASAFGHVFVDRRLYLPEERRADAARRAQAQVPAAVVFPDQAPSRPSPCSSPPGPHGVPMRWVCGRRGVR